MVNVIITATTRTRPILCHLDAKSSTQRSLSRARGPHLRRGAGHHHETLRARDSCGRASGGL